MLFLGQDDFMDWDAIGCSVAAGQQPVQRDEYSADDLKGFITEVRPSCNVPCAALYPVPVLYPVLCPNAGP